ncbi:MAG: PAC2 family protein [Nanoarchaeota archaeon]
MWKIKEIRKVKMEKPILIVGLPGIGNVGKIAADILIDEVKAEKILDFFSYTLPNSVFVNEDNLIDLPKIEIYHKKIKKQDYLFLAGDVQPTVEEASYAFAEKILDYLETFPKAKILTLGGIGLPELPKMPKVYCTGNVKSAVAEYKNCGVHTKIYGVVGPIIGISGLLLGLGKKRNIPAATLLAETYGHPVYIGLPGARAILNVLNKRFAFNIILTELDNEIKNFERNLHHAKNQPIVKKYLKYKDTSYIG